MILVVHSGASQVQKGNKGQVLQYNKDYAILAT